MPYKAIQYHNGPKKHNFCSLAQFFVWFRTFFTHASMPRTRTTKILLGPLSVARGQKRPFPVIEPSWSGWERCSREFVHGILDMCIKSVPCTKINDYRVQILYTATIIFSKAKPKSQNFPFCFSVLLCHQRLFSCKCIQQKYSHVNEKGFSFLAAAFLLFFLSHAWFSACFQSFYNVCQQENYSKENTNETQIQMVKRNYKKRNALQNFSNTEKHWYCTPHDEVEPNLKKNHHRNGIWGLEAIVM